MSSSNESEDESTMMSKSSMSKKEASNSYLTLLNSNNKFSEMLKSKIKLTDSTSNLSRHSFEPIASSTQIGTPVELKQKKHAKKHADVIKHDYRDVIVKKEQSTSKSSEDSDSERKVSKKRKLKIVKKKVSHADSSDEGRPSKTKHKEIISTKSTKHVSESSVDSESDSEDSSDTQRSTERSKSGKKHKLEVMSKEPFSTQSNFKINFAKYNAVESSISKHKLKNKKSEIDNLPSSSRIKREVSSDVESPNRRTKTVSKKGKQKLARNTSISESSDNDRTMPVIPPNGDLNEQNSSDDTALSSDKVEKHQKPNKKQKRKKKTKDHKASTSGSEDEGSKSKLQPPERLVTKGKGHNDESSASNEESEDKRQQSKKDRDKDQSNKTASSRLRKLELEDSLTSIPNHFDSFDNIKPKENIYIIQIPVKLDPNRLIGTSISLNGHVRVNKKYDSLVSYEPQEPITICNNNESANVKIFQPVGSIKLQRRLQSTEIPDVPDVSNRSVEFPTNLKSRHPLFGSNFDNKITLEEHVKMKLESVRDSPVKHKKKKKKKRHETEETEHQEEEIFKFLSHGNEESTQGEKKKKKKKRENSECEERHEAVSSKKRRSEELEEEEEVPKKKKKHKEDKEDSLIQEMLLSQIAMLDMKKKKKKKEG